MEPTAWLSPDAPLAAALSLLPLLPLLLMTLALAWPTREAASPTATRPAWRPLQALCAAAWLAALASLLLQLLAPRSLPAAGWPSASALSAAVALLVQTLGWVIAAFSRRYLAGEPGQAAYRRALAGVLAAVQLLLLADHWLLLIAAWAATGVALQTLLCHYAERPFARLAAHKKFIADRAADALLVAAAALAWTQVGSGSLSELHRHVQEHGAPPAVQLSAVLLVLAVALRTALFPVHGWLIQVMEAPTPVSALLHAGVINLGGFVLIRQAPLLDAVPLAQGLLLLLGLGTALLAGVVMLTRVSIKVRLAWSTVAQMGFMLAQCALGLYALALLHLVGHSLYKAHAFLSASERVQQARQAQLLPSPPGPGGAHGASLAVLLLAPLAALGLLLGLQSLSAAPTWPWWWSAVLALAWAPLLWTPPGAPLLRSGLRGALLVAALSGLALLLHALPAQGLGVLDATPDAWRDRLGLLTLAALALLYAGLVLLQRRPAALSRWRRWSYAGFYVDEAYTRLALRWSSGDWAPGAAAQGPRWQSTPAPR